MSRACAIVALLLAGASGEPVSLDGASLVPPAGFRRVEEAMVKGSAALVPQVSGESPRAVVAAFAESGEFATATLVVARVEKPLELDPGVRSAVASAIAGHFRGELDLEVVVDRPVLVQGAHGVRLEARAHTRVGDEPRLVRFAFVPAGAVTYVLAASLPAEPEAEYEEPVGAAFESFAAPPVALPAPAPYRGALRIAAFGLAGLLLVVGLRLWQRRRKQGADAARG